MMPDLEQYNLPHVEKTLLCVWAGRVSSSMACLDYEGSASIDRAKDNLNNNYRDLVDLAREEGQITFNLSQPATQPLVFVCLKREDCPYCEGTGVFGEGNVCGFCEETNNDKP